MKGSFKNEEPVEQYRQNITSFKFIPRPIEVKRFEGESVHFICPNTNMESNAVWKKEKVLILAMTRKSEKLRIRIDTLNALHISKITRNDAGRYECEVAGILKINIDLKVIPKANLIKTSQSDKYPQYHKFLIVWIVFLTLIFIAIIVIKCVRYQCFYKKVKYERLAVKTFSNEKANKYVTLNMSLLIGYTEEDEN